MANLEPPKIIYLEGPCALVGSDLNQNRSLVCSGSRQALLVSENHHLTWRKGSDKTLRKVWSGGGPFYCVKHTLTHTGRHELHVLRAGTDLGTFTMLGVSPGSLTPEYPTIAPFNTHVYDLSVLWTQGYERARPGNPVASLGQFIGELGSLPQVPLRGALRAARQVPFKDIPKYLLNRLLNFRDLGSEYLNLEFGWRPFVRDLQGMYALWHTVDARMAQLIRENKRYIRRKVTLSNTTTVTQAAPLTSAQAYVYVRGGVGGIAGRTFHTVTSTTEDKVWWTGSFRYHIPDTTSSLWDAKARLALFGALPSPSMLYELLPWSWLLDWFTNVGTVVSNFSANAVDNLTMRYGYVMRRNRVTTEYKVTTSHEARNTGAGGSFPTRYKSAERIFSTTSVVDTKMRYGSINPFGLGVLESGLNDHQRGILAALGISRSRLT